jgi:hypothetical protein
MNLFLIRFFLAVAFYVCVTFTGQMSIVAGAVLVAGYRSLLAFSPYINAIFGKHDLLSSILLSIIGVIAFFGLHFYVVGAFFIALGLSVGGFILKAIAAETPALSGLNKVAITSGNIGAGAILFMVDNHYMSSIGIVLVLLASSCFLKMPELLERSSVKPLTIKSLIANKTSNLVWLFFGIAIGIRVFGMYIIMPRYLIKTLGYLPNWYGLTLVLYGVVVILTQMPVIGKKVSFSLRASIIALGFSCAIMSFPNLFFIETFVGALLWCFCLALEELFAPFIDFHAARTNHLLVKEMSIGIGGALCFLLSLTDVAIECLGAISILCILLGSLCYKQALNLEKYKMF